MIWNSQLSLKGRPFIAKVRRRLADNAGNAALELAFAFGIFGTDNNLGPWVSAAVFVGCVVVVNLWFFRSLRQTRRATAAEGRKT